MSFLFNTIFYKPLLNALAGLIIYIPGHSLGFSIIILTILVNLLLLPFTHKMKSSQRKMQEIQPEIDRIKKQFKNKKEEQAKLTIELYRKHGINPLTSILLFIVQLPIILALYWIFRSVDVSLSTDLYVYFTEVPIFDPNFLGLFNLSEPSVVLAVTAALFAYFQSSLMIPKNIPAENKKDFSVMLQKQFKYMSPIIVLLVALPFPSALALYWTTMNVFGIVHEMAVRKIARNQMENTNGNSESDKSKGESA
ncbi:MAG: YidC/Oxa1 family membrane protein insertase [bacterium]|nr:YidC/Oxa1 family membrane protein insertase [bacterium]